MSMLLVAAILSLQVPDAARVESVLGKAPERRYKILVRGESIGSWTMKSSIEQDGGRKVVVLVDELDVTTPDGRQKMTIRETASLDGLRLISVKRTGDGLDWSAKVEGRKATMKVDGRESTHDTAAGTVGESGILRVVCAAEQKEKAEFKVDMLTLVAERHETGHNLRCVGREQVDIGGKKFDAFRWEHTWSGKGGGLESTRDSTYWVSPDGYLLRATERPGMEMVLDAK
jgi:hypothetical protein